MSETKLRALVTLHASWAGQRMELGSYSVAPHIRMEAAEPCGAV
jgi:hypothetical protein